MENEETERRQKKFMEENDLEGKQEIFNMSLAILERLNNLINCCASASIESDFPKWYSYLLTLKKQISYKFTKEESEKDSDFVSVINDLIPEFKSKMKLDLNNKYFLRIGEQYEHYGLLRFLLEEYEKFLLQQMDSRDMLSSKRENKRRTIGEM